MVNANEGSSTYPKHINLPFVKHLLMLTHPKVLLPISKFKCLEKEVLPQDCIIIISGGKQFTHLKLTSSVNKQNGYYVAGAVFSHYNNPPFSWDEYQAQVFDDRWNFSGWSTERYFLTYGYRGPLDKYLDWKPLNKIKSLGSESDWGPIPNKNDEDYGDVQT